MIWGKHMTHIQLRFDREEKKRSLQHHPQDRAEFNQNRGTQDLLGRGAAENTGTPLANGSL